MANGTHSSDRVKDEENSNEMPRRNGEKGKINSSSSVSDTSGVRRSPRKTSSKNMIPSPSSTQKSKGLEKRTALTSAVTRKSERVEKRNMPSPLRRSGRIRSHSSLSPSDSKSSGSLNSEQKPKKEKSVKQLTFEAKEVNENEEHDLGTSQVEIKRMDARLYRSMFQKPKNDCLVEPDKIDKSTQEGGNKGGGKIDKSSRGIDFNCKEVSKRNGMLPSKDEEMRVESLVENNLTIGSLVPSNATNSETSVVPRVQPDSCRDETLQMLESRNSLLDEDLVRNSVRHDSGENLTPSKRNGTMLDMVSDVSATLANDDDCNSIPSRLGGNIVGTGESCSKRRRLDCDHTVSCRNESCNPSATELQDGGDIDASMLQKECPANSLTEGAKNICLICKSEGQLLFCGGKGCSRCYHLSCLEPPLVDAPIGVWHCHFCVRKKIFDVYSVSEGVESVCDAKEVPCSNVDGSTAQKEFLVKYKGLAHVHSRWIPENQLLLEAPSLLMNFNTKDQTQRSKPEWSLPHRLLQKRALISSTQHDDHKINHAVDNFDCCYEWLVKWRGLGYEHATWELDNASFLRSPEGQSLMRGYEERFQRAKRVSLCSKLAKVSQKAAPGSSVNKLCQMPGGVSSGVGNNNLDAVNKLREHWYNGQNAIVIDDHDRILKVVAFILSLHSDTYRPFLIISTAATLHAWEDEFYQLDPSIDVVIYSGNKEIRNGIRRLEFYDGGGCILFQVLIIVPEILIEDIDVLGGIEWEAIIVDECQSPKFSSYLETLKILNTHLRILLYRGQLKDSIVEYINILALLDCQSDNEKEDGLIPNSNNNIDQLKERLSSHIAYRCKSDSFRFVEYWVPVQISHVQLEQYCATLHSNASILRSSSKLDIEALRDVLIKTRKCCSHPYIVDPSLKSLLTMGLEAVEYLDVEIKASGKLQLLDSLLMELRKKNLRGLILFQSIGGSGKVSLGDILDDFLRLRYGLDSYERIDKGLSQSKKHAAMRKFNNKDDGRFVFLLETCACRPNIKLSSVDTIIIFDSDWNPMNDIRSLQKITFDSQPELIKIFRLYSSFTVEENALILAKQDKTLDINLQNISRSTCHMLLMRGASSLFDDLKVFHDGETSVSSQKSSSGQQLLKETVHEFSSILSQDGEDNDTSSCLILLKVQQNGGTYRANFSLLGELKHRLLDEEPPVVFWTKLLEGKQFRWKYSCNSSQRSRKRVNHFDGSVNKADHVSEGIAKKRRKVSNYIVDQPSSKSEGVKLSNGIKADRPRCNDVESEKKSRLRDEQRSLHLLLKPEITKLYKVLLLPDNVKNMVDNFLEYVMNNHDVNREPVSILQAFQISLCWTAAALLKHKLDHKASLLLAKQHLNFDCKKEEVDYMYSMLRCLKRIFLYRTRNSNDTDSPKASESSKRVYSGTDVAQEVDLFKKDLSKSIKEIQKKCENQLTKLSHMQQEEKRRLETAIEDEKADFERRYKIELAIIRSCSPNDVMRTEKLKVLNSEYGKKFEELKLEHEKRLKVLEDTQLDQKQKFKDKEDTWVEDVKFWAQNELSNIVALKGLGTRVEYSQSQTCDQEQPHSSPKNEGLVSDRFTEGKSHDNMIEAMTRTGTGVPEIDSSAVVLCSMPVELQTPAIKHTAADEMGNMASEDRSVSRSEDHDIAENQNDSQGNIIPRHSHSIKQNFDGATTMTYEGDRCENVSRGSRDGCGDDTLTLVLPSSNGERCDGETSDVPRGEVAPVLCQTSSSNDGQDEVHSSTQSKLDGTRSSMSGCAFSLEVNPNSLKNGTKTITSLNSLLPKEHIPGVIALCPQHCENAAQIHEADDCNGSNNAIIENSPLSDERISDGAIVGVLDTDAPVGMPPRTVNGTDCPENVSAASPPPSMEQVLDGVALNEVLDRELSRPCASATPSNDSDTITLSNPPLEYQNPDGVSSSIPDGQIPTEVPETSHEEDRASVLGREIHVETPGMVNFSECPGNTTPPNPLSSMDQTSDRGSINVPVLDSVLSSRPCQAASPRDGPGRISVLNLPLEQHVSDGVSLSIPNGDILVIMPEDSHEVADCHNGIQPSTDAVLVDRSTISNQQEGVPRTVMECTLSQETPVSRPVDVIKPLEQVQQISSVEASPDQDTAGEMQNSSEQVELVSSPVDVVPANQSNQVSLIIEPSEQVQQLPSSEHPSSNQHPSNILSATGVEHQPASDDLPRHEAEASTVVPNQDVVQADSNLELDSHSHAVVHSAVNSDSDSLRPGGVRTEPSNTRNLSTPSDINNHPPQTETHSASRMLPPSYSDPLKNELERICKVTEQLTKNHEDMRLRLKSDFEKELAELRGKYDIKFQEIEIEFQQTKNDLDTSFRTVIANKLLADAFKSKCMDRKLSGAYGMQQDASVAQQLLQFARQQGGTWPSQLGSPSSCGSPAASLRSPSTPASSQNMLPPIQAACNTSGIFSGVPARPPLRNSVSSPSGNFQVGGEMRAPAPHLQPYRPSTSVPAASHPAFLPGMPIQPAPNNIPATSPSLSNGPPQPNLPTYRPDPHMGCWPDSAGGFPALNLPAMDLRVSPNSQSTINLSNVLPSMSDVASLNPSGLGSSSSVLANPSNQAASPDLVCLSDDD